MTTASITPASMIASYRTRGVRLWADGEKLEVAAPKGVLGDDDYLSLKARKPEIIACLAEESAGSDGQSAGYSAGSAAMPWRLVLTRWPVDARESWGRRAAQLEEAGTAWPDSERMVFEEINGGPASVDDAAMAAIARAREIEDAEFADGRYPAWTWDSSLAFDPFEAKAAIEKEININELAGRKRDDDGGVVSPPSGGQQISVSMPGDYIVDIATKTAMCPRACEKPGCGSIVANMGPGKTNNGASLRCAKCDSWMGWLPKRLTPEGWPKDEGGRGRSKDRGPSLFDR